jgi:menaquinone-dependent protoporphyrinogen oxidase
VILGAPIRGGKWVSGAHSFLERHAEELSDRPVAVFAVGGSLRPDPGNPDAEETVRAAVDTVTRAFPRLDVIDVRLFAGRIDRALLPPAMRLLTRLARLPEGDWRDWNAIRGWATTLAPRIVAQP